MPEKRAQSSRANLTALLREFMICTISYDKHEQSVTCLAKEPKMDIKRHIMDRLDETEEAYGVKIVLAVESGSRGWGFPSLNSDHDVRFVYARKLDWYLALDEGKDYIGFPPDPVFDIQGWDIRKALRLMKRSNASILEWLSSPMRYKEDPGIAAEMKLLGEKCFDMSKCLKHYRSIAANALRLIEESDMAKLKKYFYCLRPLAASQYILKKGLFPPMEYLKTVAEIEMPEGIREETAKLVEMKKATNEDLLIVKNQVLLSYMEDALAWVDKEAAKLPRSDKREIWELDAFFKKVVTDAQELEEEV
jgi:predicted nucleotidyltransferase